MSIRFSDLFNKIKKKKKKGSGLKLHPAALLQKASRCRYRIHGEGGRCDGRPIKGGFVCRRLHFETSGVQSPLARVQTGVKGLRCCLKEHREN